MTDISKHPLLAKCSEVMQAIEACAASEQLTAAVLAAMELQRGIETLVDSQPAPGEAVAIPLDESLYCELEGVIIDAERDGRFDSVCLDTLRRVQAQLRPANAAAPVGYAPRAKCDGQDFAAGDLAWSDAVSDPTGVPIYSPCWEWVPVFTRPTDAAAVERAALEEAAKVCDVLAAGVTEMLKEKGPMDDVRIARINRERAYKIAAKHIRTLRNPAPDQQDERYKPRTTTQGQSEQPAKEE